jgi:hypothetical protein
VVADIVRAETFDNTKLGRRTRVEVDRIREGVANFSCLVSVILIYSATRLREGQRRRKGTRPTRRLFESRTGSFLADVHQDYRFTSGLDRLSRDNHPACSRTTISSIATPILAFFTASIPAFASFLEEVVPTVSVNLVSCLDLSTPLPSLKPIWMKNMVLGCGLPALNASGEPARNFLPSQTVIRCHVFPDSSLDAIGKHHVVRVSGEVVPPSVQTVRPMFRMIVHTANEISALIFLYRHARHRRGPSVRSSPPFP